MTAVTVQAGEKRGFVDPELAESHLDLPTGPIDDVDDLVDARIAVEAELEVRDGQ